jgi:hypothetical protein
LRDSFVGLALRREENAEALVRGDQRPLTDRLNAIGYRNAM